MNIDFDDYKEKYAKKEGFKKWCELRQSYFNNPLYRQVPEFVYMRIFEMVVEDFSSSMNDTFFDRHFGVGSLGIKLHNPYSRNFNWGGILDG